jgi:hypothetical protein
MVAREGATIPVDSSSQCLQDPEVAAIPVVPSSQRLQDPLVKKLNNKFALGLYACLLIAVVSMGKNTMKIQSIEANRSETKPGQASKHVFYCPQPNKTVDATFPVGMPQNISNRWKPNKNQTGFPFITMDAWVGLVDNRRTFFLRPLEGGFPTMERLRDWIRSRPHPITLVMNNNHDFSWPADLTNKDYELILNETNLHAVYAVNPRKLAHYPKLKPIPIGNKWQFGSTRLFGEDKTRMLGIYSNVSTSAKETQKLFANENRTSTVWVRPMAGSNTRNTSRYIRDTPALELRRWGICTILKETIKEAVICAPKNIAHAEYFEELKKHRFMVSPAGNGLDTHSTWEALLAGCIPIVPRSALDPMFEDLPVWLVDSWEEVTAEAVLRHEQEWKVKTFKWEKLFQPSWGIEIHKGLCTISPNETKLSAPL